MTIFEPRLLLPLLLLLLLGDALSLLIAFRFRTALPGVDRERGRLLLLDGVEELSVGTSWRCVQ